jgi:hypothetical protein
MQPFDYDEVKSLSALEVELDSSKIQMDCRTMLHCGRYSGIKQLREFAVPSGT